MIPIPYRLAWDAGPNALVDVFNTAEPPAAGFYLKYTPPFRSTVSSGPFSRDFAKGRWDIIDDQVSDIGELLGFDGRGRGADAAGAPGDQQVLAAIRRLGIDLYKKLLPRPVQLDLEHHRSPFLELCLDESLLQYPWELSHDGQNFLCLKHKIGRFINTTSLAIPPADFGWWEGSISPLRVLVIAVPKPATQKGVEYPVLPEAKAEAEELIKLLTGNAQKLGVEVIAKVGQAATRTDIIDILQSNKNYQFVHFCGHAQFDENDPQGSRLILFDKPMLVSDVVDNVSNVRPIFCFINACESGMMAPLAEAEAERARRRGETACENDSTCTAWPGDFSRRARYLLGTRWRIGDKAAATFAKHFYHSLLVDQEPLGEAIRKGRVAWYDDKVNRQPTDCDWASYVFYGDPRVRFVREAESPGGEPRS